MTVPIEQDPRWQAVARRDPEAEGQFYYSVATTGIYCRPTCPARRPDPRHVGFHATTAAAEAAGFRPCKRCRPDEPSLLDRHAHLVQRACRQIEASDSLLSLEWLAQSAGLSAHHFHRIFKALTGVTPRAYGVAQRATRLRDALPAASRVTDAIYDAGYGASSRHYDTAEAVLGMSTHQYRQRGEGMVIRHATGRSALGVVFVAVTEIGVCAILLGEDPADLLQDARARFPKAHWCADGAGLTTVLATVLRAVDQPSAPCDLALDIRGTAFQQRVWQALRAVRPGEMTTYTAIAKAVGAPRAVRAVAGACAANPLAVVVPCHRVRRRDGALAGYRWGVARKRALLRQEGAVDGTLLPQG